MKLFFVSLFALLSTGLAQAQTIRGVLEQIARAAVPGNGGSHHVTTLDEPFSEGREVGKLREEVDANAGEDCRFNIRVGVQQALKTIRESWHDERTARRLEGLAKNGVIHQVVYSEWDPASGDSEYCLMSLMKVYAIDQSVLVLDYNETD